MTTDLSPQETARKLMERKADIEAEIVRLPACAASWASQLNSRG